MNRFVFFYILELIALLVLVVMPNERVDLKFILIMGGISLVLWHLVGFGNNPVQHQRIEKI